MGGMGKEPGLEAEGGWKRVAEVIKWAATLSSFEKDYAASMVRCLPRGMLRGMSRYLVGI